MADSRPPASDDPRGGDASHDAVTAAAPDATDLRRVASAQAQQLREGFAYTWGSSLAVVLMLLMVFGMVLLILVNGLGHFWPSALVEITLHDGTRYLGEVDAHDSKPRSRAERLSGSPQQFRTKMKIGNRDISRSDFIWIDDARIVRQRQPHDAVVLERLEYGNFYGWVKEVRNGAQVLPGSGGDELETLRRTHERNAAVTNRIASLERKRQKLRRPLTTLERKVDALRGSAFNRSPERASELRRLQDDIGRLRERLSISLQALAKELQRLREEAAAWVVVMETASGETRTIQLAYITLISQPNSMALVSKTMHYLRKLVGFVWDNPRESNTEGGIFPAIFGTVLLVLLMTVVVVPFGILAAVYMHEYAKQGRLLRMVRVAVNNLAGVPSIVIGMFGLAFFVYGVGGAIDRFFYSEYLPTPTLGSGGILWASLTLALLTLPVVIVATEEGLASVPQAYREASLSLGTTKWQTIHRIVLPNATPGILTGVILAVSRAAGEVAPLMLTGVVKLAPSLALDSSWPFLHVERKFMHLGFHIYDVAMQSPNVEAAMPMVYSTTALLLVLVLMLNSGATILRNRLRKRYAGATL